MRGGTNFVIDSLMLQFIMLENELLRSNSDAQRLAC